MMGGRMSREKGARGEREIIALLQPIVTQVCDELNRPVFELRRNPSQRFAAKQYDVIGLPWVALEVKRVENLSGLGSWWKQTLEATNDRQTPVLVYRPNHVAWKVRIRTIVAVVKGGPHIRMTMDLDWHTFLTWFKAKLFVELSQ
tara:strand:- start:141 stop:575 length:435 start_codon:yes stop_codon:yes gene_type:complete